MANEVMTQFNLRPVTTFLASWVRRAAYVRYGGYGLAMAAYLQPGAKDIVFRFALEPRLAITDTVASPSINTVFRVASISKIITARIIAEVCDDLDVPIGQIVAGPFAGVDLGNKSLKHLLSHTAGITDQYGYFTINDALVTKLNSHLYAKRNTALFEYSNLGFIMAASIVELSVKKPFGQIAKEFCLRHSLPYPRYNWSYSDVDSLTIQPGLRRNDLHWQTTIDAPCLLPKGDDALSLSPHSGARLSIGELVGIGAVVLKQQDEPTWVKGETESVFTGDEAFEAYGSGCQFIGPVLGAEKFEVVGHFGRAYGFAIGVWFNRRTQATVAYMMCGVPDGYGEINERDQFLAQEAELLEWFSTHDPKTNRCHGA